MSVTIDVRGLAPQDYVFTSAPLAELSAAIHLLVEPAHHPMQNPWITSTAASVEPELLDRLIDADFLWRTSRPDMLLPGTPSGSLVDDLDAMDRLDDERWVSAALLTSSCGTVPLHRDLGSPLTDPAARDLARERARSRGPRQGSFVEFVLDRPARARTVVRQILEDCDRAFFADAWKTVERDLRSDARVKRDLLHAFGLGRALAAVSSAVTLSDSGDRIVVDKLQDDGTSAGHDGVTFLPSFFGHPHLLVVHAPGWRPVIQYPVATRAAGSSTATVDDVQRRLHALDNPVRLRLARSLIRGAKTTTELAESWGLSAPDVSRHLAILKEAGLLTTTREGRRVLYQVDVVAIARLG